MAATIVSVDPAHSAAQAGADPSGSSTFVILIGGTRIGTESVTISKSPTGWLVSGAGRLQPPIDLTTNKFEVSYGPDWQPQQLSVEASLRGQPTTLTTTFGLTTAASELRQGAQRGATTHNLAPRAVVLPVNFFGAYESLAVRLAGAVVGTRVPVYVPTTGEATATVSQMATRRISFGDRTTDLIEVIVTITSPSGATPVEMWIEPKGRLARLLLPTSGIVAIRDDLATVMAREERVRHPGDEDEFIGADGFNLSATVTRPAGNAARAPAVVLVAAPGPQDRDYLTYGIPLFADLAGVLSEAGYRTVRYDPRGSGRSGGRSETSRLQEYSDDVIAIVRWLQRRRDVDDRRITVITYGDGGPIGLLSVSRFDTIAGVGLLASPGRTGREVTLEQQQLSLSRSKMSEAERSSRLALQTRVIDSVITGKGWEGIPDEVRSQADTLWFRSWLQFDPAATLRRIERPLLILHGGLDTETSPAHAQRLDSLARARTNVPAAYTDSQVFPSLNHLFVPAKTGQIEEYPLLEAKAVAPEVSKKIIEWLAGVRR